LDFDVKDEMSNMRKKVKTSDEINLCSTNEEYSLVQKAIHIMKKGYEVQKKSVVSHLAFYLADPKANDELLPLILHSIDAWDTQFQCLLADSLYEASDECLLNPSNLHQAMKLCIEFVDNLNNDDVYYSWRKTFPKLAYQLNTIPDTTPDKFSQTTILETIVYSRIAEMVDRKQEKRRRLRGCELMKDLVQTQGGHILCSQIHIKYFLALSQDPNFIYRADMAAALG